MSANSLTNAVVDYLNLNGWKAWRNNTVGIYDPKKKVYRKNPKQLKGVPDVIGFHKKEGTFIGIEIKIGKDKLSEHQKQFLDELSNSKGVAMVVKSVDDFETQMIVVDNYMS